MRMSAADRARIREMGTELRKLVGGAYHADGKAKTFDELEELSIEVSDIIFQTVLESLVKDTPEPESSRCCPECEKTCPRRPDDEQKGDRSRSPRSPTWGRSG